MKKTRNSYFKLKLEQYQFETQCFNKKEKNKTMVR